MALALMAALGALGCDGGGARVTVFLDAQRGSRSVATSLRVRVLGADGSVRLDDVRAVDPESAWPLRLPLVPEGGDADRSWAVEATLTDADGEIVSIARARGGYVAGAPREAGICLADGCASEPCGASDGCAAGLGCETCVQGACLDATATLLAVGTAPRCPIAGCLPSGTNEQSCSDGVDDDCDSRIDCLDPDCGCDAGACTPTEDENTLAACHDGLDNDCDGRIDCEEGTDCVLSEGPDRCTNGIDDDCDGAIDCLDDACCSSPSCDERPCGGGGLRCCAGRCVNTYDDRQHCGACNNSCGAFECDRPTSSAGGPVQGALCRCGAAGNRCTVGTCARHGALGCNCGTDCPGDAVCVDQPGDHHSYCFIPPPAP